MVMELVCVEEFAILLTRQRWVITVQICLNISNPSIENILCIVSSFPFT